MPAFEHSLWENVTTLKRAFGAIEMALWDLRGRAEDKPLHLLLGGAVRREIAFTEYFSLRHPGAAHPGESTPLEVARYCARMIEEYDSPTFEGKLATVGLEDELEMVREVRAAIGDRPLRLDANHAWTVPTARDVLRRLAPYDIRCIEEPVGSHEELARLRPFTDIAFSAHAPDLRRAVALGVPDFYVLNIVELGGIRRTVEFVRACEMFGIGFWFHSRRHRRRERGLPAAVGRAGADPRAQSGALPLVRRRRHRRGPVLPAARRPAGSGGPRPGSHARRRRPRALPRALPRRGCVPVRRGRRAGAHAGLVRRAQAVLTVLSDFR